MTRKQAPAGWLIDFIALLYSAKLLSSIVIEESGITELPKGTLVCLRGAVVEAEYYFNPETLTPDIIFSQENAEQRRVLLEMAGLEKILNSAESKVIATDKDTGALRQVLDITYRLHIPDNMFLYNLNVRDRRNEQRTARFLSCSCPSTQRQYMLQIYAANSRDN